MNENTKILVAVLASVILSVICMGALVMLDTPIRESLIGPQGIQGLRGERGLQGKQGDLGIGIQGVQGIGIQGLRGYTGLQGEPGDPAFDWVNVEDVETVWKFGGWVNESRFEYGATFTITEPVWYIDFTSGHQLTALNPYPTRSSGHTALIQIYRDNPYGEPSWQWRARNIFAQTRLYMAGEGDYYIMIRLNDAYRVDITVKQIVID